MYLLRALCILERDQIPSVRDYRRARGNWGECQRAFSLIIRNQAYIGSNCVIGHSADVKRSICLNGAKMQCGIFVGDSILGCGARIGSGVILANRKFNQTKVQFRDKDETLQDFWARIFRCHCRSLLPTWCQRGHLPWHNYPRTYLGWCWLCAPRRLWSRRVRHRGAKPQNQTEEAIKIKVG